MKHAREDYDRIQDPAGLIPADEPVFLLRGQDSLAWRAVDYYARLAARELGEDHSIVTSAIAHAVKMRGAVKKLPDLPTKTIHENDLDGALMRP